MAQLGYGILFRSCPQVKSGQPHAGDAIRNCAGRFRGNVGGAFALVLARDSGGGGPGPKREHGPPLKREDHEVAPTGFEPALPP